MKKIYKSTFYFCALFVLIGAVMSTGVTLAQEDLGGGEVLGPPSGANNRIMDRLKSVAGEGGYVVEGGTSLPEVVGVIINAFISLLGIIFVVLIVSAGFTWMTSEGNEKKIKKATATIKASVIGLIITLSAWSLWNFIFMRLIL